MDFSQLSQSESNPENDSSSKAYKPSKFYCVYLLNSLKNKNKYYIGSTPHPVRRLRQHNGHLTMGAKKTSKEDLRPWEMVMIVHGFMSNITALQFEVAWQKPYCTRFINEIERINKTKNKRRNIEEILGSLRLLLKCNYFLKQNLKIEFFSNNNNIIYNLWINNKFGIFIKNNDILINNHFKDVEECYVFNLENLEKNQEKYSLSKNEINNCDICYKLIDNTTTQKKLVTCYHCEFKSHLVCLANHFLTKNKTATISDKSKYFKSKKLKINSQAFQLSQSTNKIINNYNFNQGSLYLKDILPIKTNCLNCGKILHWNELIRIIN